MAFSTHAPQNSQFRGKTPEPVIIHQLDGSGEPVAIREEVATTGTFKTVDVGTTGVVILNSNTSRIGFLITNQGYPGIGAETSVFLGFTNAVVAPGATAGTNRGFELAFGESISSNDLPGYKGAIYAISAAGDSAQLSAVEW